MRNRRFVSAGEHGGDSRRPHGMLEGETNCWSGSARRTPANGIHDEEHGPALRPKKLVHIFRSQRFFNAVLGEIAPHRSNKFLRVGHDVILH